MKTIEHFERALGRVALWAPRFKKYVQDGKDKIEKHYVRRLRIYPHALREANSFYSPDKKALLLGYFPASFSDPDENLPGGIVFCSLSHDVIAHETTHALLDGLHRYFGEPTNPDVLAFHEGFADLCALFAHFSHKEALTDAIRRTGGRLYQTDLAPIAPRATGEPNAPQLTGQISKNNPLIQLAIQFGQARGGKRGLRSALGSRPNADDIHKKVDDPHFRGSILVAAVFDAFFSVYTGRAESLFRIYRAGGGSRIDDLPAILAELLASCASETATHFFRLCARALDYCPPVDVTFGDFLRALITVSKDLDPTDNDGVRDALMEAFRLRAIYAENASFYSEDALCWPRMSDDLPAIADLVFGNPNGLTTAEKDRNGAVLRAWAHAYRGKLGLDPDLPVTVPSFHPVFRTLQNGRLRMEMVVEIIQTRTAPFDPGVPEAGSFPFRGGVTLIVEAPEMVDDGKGQTVALPPVVRFAIAKASVGDESKRREQTQRSFAIAQGLAAGDTTKPGHFQANFGLLHEEY